MLGPSRSESGSVVMAPISSAESVGMMVVALGVLVFFTSVVMSTLEVSVSIWIVVFVGLTSSSMLFETPLFVGVTLVSGV